MNPNEYKFQLIISKHRLAWTAEEMLYVFPVFYERFINNLIRYKLHGGDKPTIFC